MDIQIVECCEKATEELEKIISYCEAQSIPDFALLELARKVGYIQGIILAIKINYETNLTAGELVRKVMT